MLFTIILCILFNIINASTPEVLVVQRDEWTSQEKLKLAMEIFIFSILIMISTCAGYWTAVILGNYFKKNDSNFMHDF